MGLPDTTGTEISGKDFPPIKPDWYEVILSAYEEKDSKSGEKYTNLEFKIIENERKCWGILSHQDVALWKVKQFKIAIGMPDSDINLEQYVGSRLLIFARDHEYNGKHYPEVTDYKPLKTAGDALPWEE